MTLQVLIFVLDAGSWLGVRHRRAMAKACKALTRLALGYRMGLVEYIPHCRARVLTRYGSIVPSGAVHRKRSQAGSRVDDRDITFAVVAREVPCDTVWTVIAHNFVVFVICGLGGAIAEVDPEVVVGTRREYTG